MSFSRWLLIHSFSIFLVSLFVLGYIYREELQLQQAYHQLLNQPLLPDRLQAPEEKQKQPEGDEPVQPAQQEIARPEEKVEAAEKTLDDTQTKLIESRSTVSSTIIELDELLLKARKAYWDKDYSLAIQYYQQLIQGDANNPDYIGELGNIYYSLNEYEKAAQHFYRAAIVLMSQDKPEQARRLVSPVSAMNRDLGDQLKRELNQP